MHNNLLIKEEFQSILLSLTASKIDFRKYFVVTSVKVKEEQHGFQQEVAVLLLLVQQLLFAFIARPCLVVLRFVLNLTTQKWYFDYKLNKKKVEVTSTIFWSP